MASVKHYRSKLRLKYDRETKQFVKDGGMDAVGYGQKQEGVVGFVFFLLRCHRRCVVFVLSCLIRKLLM